MEKVSPSISSLCGEVLLSEFFHSADPEGLGFKPQLVHSVKYTPVN